MLGACEPNATLILAGVDRLLPQSQVVLARFLKTTKAKVVATAQSLDSIESDLLLRLSSFERVTIPPLRDRLGELPTLVRSIVSDLCQQMRRPVLEVDGYAIRVLQGSPWPGNVRELYGVIAKGIMESHTATFQLPAEFLNEEQHLAEALESITGGKPFSLDRSLYIIERLILRRTLQTYQWNQSRTAQILGLSEANFRYRLKKFGLPSRSKTR